MHIHTKKRNRLEHKKLNALVYVKYNTRLRERSIQRRQNVDSFFVNEADSDDEWITEKEDPVLPEDPSWFDNDTNMFSVDAVRTMSLNRIYERTSAMKETSHESHSSMPKSKKRNAEEISILSSKFLFF